LSGNDAGAKRRWQSLINKFKDNHELYSEYKSGIDRWLQMGALERVPMDHLLDKKPGEFSVIPHHVVYKETSTTTKARVVCDAAAHEKGKLSINDAMSAGSNLLPTIFDILIRIRFGKILIVGDIDAAFLQIGLNEEDADKLFFYWVRQEVSSDGEITWCAELYRFKRLPWGLNVSPFLLLFVLSNHLMTYAKDGEEIEISKKIIENLYMDDLIRTFNDVKSAVKETRYAIKTLAAAKFPLRKLNSNNEEVKRLLGILENDPLASNRVLGFLYDSETDSLRPDVAALKKLEKLNYLTPRLALRAHSIVFDPLGLAEHWHFKAKILMQKTWDLGLGWDDRLPNYLTHEWFTWIRSWRAVQSIKVPRFTGDLPNTSEFHVFCDASEQGYSAGVYVVTDGKCRLLCSKAKVIPVRFRKDKKTKELKYISIPRAELLAAELGTKLWKSVSSALHTSSKPTFWSDSQTALWWIKTTAVKFKVFVSNRVDKIREITEPSQWRHVPGKENPADLATRQVSGFDAASSRLWFKGPKWICERDEWPVNMDMNTPSNSAGVEVSLNRQKGQTKSGHDLVLPLFISENAAEVLMMPTYETVETNASFENILPPGYRCQLAKACELLVLHARGLVEETGTAGPFSSLVELSPQRDAVERLELSSDLRLRSEDDSLPAPTSTISIEELEAAKRWLIIKSQQHYLPGITACLKIDSLSKREDFPEEVLRPVLELGLRLDKDGIIRSHGRTAMETERYKTRLRVDPHIYCPDTAKALILIPGNGFLGECIMYTAHLATMHWGRNNMTHWTRSEYWVINPSKLATKVKRHCAVCTNYYSKPFVPLPSGLPEKRFSPAYAFQHTGLDYVSVRFERKKNTIKGKEVDQEKYIIICLFTCMVTRAVHLEYADDYTKEEFARVFKSFCHRRAIPQTVVSDNGSNFEPIARTIRPDTSAAEQWHPEILWQFLPREAPNWGGFYERLNKSVKDCLAKEFPRLANKPFMEIESALADITYRLNCRPLWAVSMDRDDVEVLTPNHFLVTGPTGSYGPPSEQSISSLRKFHVSTQKQLDHIWSYFARSYLSALRVQHKWDQSLVPPNLKVGDFVMVPQKKVLKTRWPIARITGFVKTSSNSELNAANIEVYVSDRVNTRLKNKLFGARTRIKDLSPDQVRQVSGCFVRNEKAVLLKNLFPYEMWRDTDVEFETPLIHDELPTNFPGHPTVLTDPLADFDSEKADKEKRRLINRQKREEQREVKRQKMAELAEARNAARAPVVRSETDRPRRKKTKYDRNYQDVADGRYRR
jgi:hypothetical protein